MKNRIICLLLILNGTLSLYSQHFYENEIIESYVFTSLKKFRVKKFKVKSLSKKYYENFEFKFNENGQLEYSIRITSDNIFDSTTYIYNSYGLKVKENMKLITDKNSKNEYVEYTESEFFYNNSNQLLKEIGINLTSNYRYLDTFIYNKNGQLFRNETFHNQYVQRSIFGDSTYEINDLVSKKILIYKYNSTGLIIYKSIENVNYSYDEYYYNFESDKLIKSMIKYPPKGTCNRHIDAKVDHYEYKYEENLLKEIFENGKLYSNYKYDKNGLLIKSNGNTYYNFSYIY